MDVKSGAFQELQLFKNLILKIMLNLLLHSKRSTPYLMILVNLVDTLWRFKLKHILFLLGQKYSLDLSYQRFYFYF